MKLRWVVALPLFLLAAAVFADYWSAEPIDAPRRFVGRDACVSCHQEQAESFFASDHDKAMDLATDATVLGDFNDVTFSHDGIDSRLYRDGNRFMVFTEGEDGAMQDFEVKYVFGVYPLQQYMVEFDRTDDHQPDELARLQVLRISWDSEQNRWFYLRPPDVDEKLEPDDPLHWTGIAQRWQTMCADCHSTNLKRNFDPKTTRYHTTFSEIDVSCEACHGPGSLHVKLANTRSLFWDRRHGYGLAKLKTDDTEPQLQACAPCHSRRGLLDEAFRPGPHYFDHFRLETLGETTYHVDGQIKDEVYVYGSFIQSKMYHKDIRCTDCHDPHSLKLKYPGNQTCTSCHQHSAGKYDVPSHHHHAPGTPGAMCVNCHMPHTTYMEVDPRRDHSLRVPRPDLSVKLGTPNACSSCHVRDQLDKMTPDAKTQWEPHDYQAWLALVAESGETAVTADGKSLSDLIRLTDQWCDDACETWYGDQRKQPRHFAETLAKVRNREKGALQDAVEMLAMRDERAPAIARATTLEALASRQISGTPRVAAELLGDSNEHPLVRSVAASSLSSANPAISKPKLIKALDDPSRLVRTSAARALAGSPALGALSTMERTRLDSALNEVKEEFMVASDRSGAHMGWAMICEQMGRIGEAIESYQTAIRVEPTTTGPRSHLANLLEQAAPNVSPQEGAQLVARAKQLRKEELPFLERDADLAPDLAPIQYRLGLAYYLDGQLQPARERLERAIKLEPGNEQYTLALRLLLEKINGQ